MKTQISHNLASIPQPAVSGNLLEERICIAFNMTRETFDALPKGLPAELNALLAQRDALLGALSCLVADGECYCANNVSSPCGHCAARNAINLAKGQI
jgi:hypothetical protein